MKDYFRSVRVRLTLGYAGALALMVLVFSMGIYLFVARSLGHQTASQLQAAVTAISRAIPSGDHEIAELEEHGTVNLFQITEGNRTVYTTAAWRYLPPDQALQEQSATSSWTWQSPEDHLYYLKLTTLPVSGRTYRILAAVDGTPARHTLQSLGWILLLGFPCTLALAMLSGLFLAGRVLSPVGTMADKAREITAERLSERLPVTNREDEFGRLATVFNCTLERLQDSFEHLRRFTADASHELRTPLTTMRSVGEVGLRDGRDANALREVIGSMLEEAERLSRLVDSLLLLTRAESGRAILSPETFRADVLVAEVTDCLHVLAEEKRQSLVVDCSSEVDVTADRATLRQALVNLLDNAIKYSPPGSGIRIVVRSDLPDTVQFEVVDAGPGIPAEHQFRVFERFYRIDRARSSETGGTGLGLAIARWAVEANGGHLELQSVEGQGSLFRIVLPRTAMRSLPDP